MAVRDALGVHELLANRERGELLAGRRWGRVGRGSGDAARARALGSPRRRQDRFAPLRQRYQILRAE